MWYILYMNKDVIYVEPEDDITDIILKIENSKEKIVALVPPKKAGVFRSVVNIKLIAKSGISSGKKVVLVTVDPSILRLAGAAKIPATKNLQTPPTIPDVDAEPETLKAETLVEESDGEVETEEDVEELIDGSEKEEDKETEEDKDDKKKETKEENGDDEGEEEGDEEGKKSAKSENKKGDKTPKKSGGIREWIQNHKKLVIIGGIGGVLLIIFLVWAFAIAPSVSIAVGVKATSNNFSEAVSFTTNLNEEKASEGKFYLEEKKIEDIKEVEFEATGKKNVGETASGDVVVYAYFKDKGAIQVSKGSNFTVNGLTYVATDGTTLSWDGEDSDVCDNKNNASQLIKSGCQISGRVKVTAAEPGSKYNTAATSTGWDTTAPVGVYSDKAMSGGTDAEITIVQQSDIDKAKESLASSNESENKEKLLSGIDKGTLVIDSSFKQTTGEAVSTPGVGEEVKDGTKPKLKAVTTASVFVVDRTKLEEFISEKADLKDDQKIYEMKDPFVENFAQTSSGITGKLKTTYLSGPRVTVSSVVDIVKGRGLGDAQHALKDIEGIADVRIDTSVPWVMSVPGDTNKISVQINVKDQNGSELKIDTDKEEKTEEKKSDSKDEEKKDDSKSEEKKE